MLKNKLDFNPYESPDSLLVAEAVWSKQEQQLWQVALWQKYLMWFLLIFLGSNAILGYAYFVTEHLTGEESGLNITTSAITLIAFAISWCVVTLSVVKMELIRHSHVAAVSVIIAMLIPGINLLVLLGINRSGTKFLRQHQVRVGLFGAEMGDIRRHLKKKVGEIDPDKVKSESAFQTTAVAQVALPVETDSPMVARIIPATKHENSKESE